MKYIKKGLATILVFLTLTLLFPVSASALTTYIGDFGYELNSTTKEAIIVRYIGKGTEPEMPTDVCGYKVTKISDSVFYENQVINKIVIPNSINTIGDYAFSNCTSLEKIVIPSSVNVLGKGVLSGCTALRKAEVNASVSALPQSTFYNCTSLTDVTLSDQINEYKNFTFYNCSSLKSLVVPRAVTSISDSAFSGAENLKIYCFKDSYAQIFAENKGISYSLFQKGDVNLDGRIDINDATAIQLYIAGKSEISDDSLSLSDVNGDGAILITDATELQKALVGLISL